MDYYFNLNYRVIFNKIIAIICIICLSSCVNLLEAAKDSRKILGNTIDPKVNLTRGQFEDNLVPNVDNSNLDKFVDVKIVDPDEAADIPSIPDFSEILTAPTPPNSGFNKLISMSIDENISLKDVLLEISRVADVDIEIDPKITGGIILRIKEQPFIEVIDRICRIAGLRYKHINNMLRIEVDNAYIKNYNVDFLNMSRSNISDVAIDTKSLNSSTGTSPSGSRSNIKSEYESDLWTSVENNIKSILAMQPNNLSTNDYLAAPLNGSYTINKQAGVISVLATDQQHNNIGNFLEKIISTASAQVLIEAKVVEVTLDDKYKSGVNWGEITDKAHDLHITGNFASNITETANIFKISHTDKNNVLSSAVSLTENFGVSRTLSSPRLHAINNQQSVLTFATNEIYFTLEAEEEETGEIDPITGRALKTLNITSTLNSVPIGIILTLQPSINLETNEITMNIRPTLSRITGYVDDPGVAIIARNNDVADIVSQVPIIEVRELDSILKIKSGEVMVIGGLMKEESTGTDAGVPGINRLPIIGRLAKATSKENKIVETVIFIKATIVPGNSSAVHKADKNLYNKFTRDPRPLAF